MINAIIQGIFTLILSLVNLILYPIDALIAQFLPSLSDALTYISNFFDTIGSVVPWVISYSGLNNTVALVIVNTCVFLYTVPLMVSSIKLGLSWYDKLKL